MSNELINKIITEKFLPFHVFKYEYQKLDSVNWGRHFYHLAYSKYCIKHRKLYGGLE